MGIEDHCSTPTMLGIEAQRLTKDFKVIEHSYGNDVLTLTVYVAYIKRVLTDAQIQNYLLQFHPEILKALKAETSYQVML